MSEIQTIKVKRDGPKGYRIINLASFDLNRHTVYSDAPVLAADAPAILSDAEMRAAIKAATGKAPGPRTSHDELVRQFNEIEG